MTLLIPVFLYVPGRYCSVFIEYKKHNVSMTNQRQQQGGESQGNFLQSRQTAKTSKDLLLPD